MANSKLKPCDLCIVIAKAVINGNICLVYKTDLIEYFKWECFSYYVDSMRTIPFCWMIILAVQLDAIDTVYSTSSRRAINYWSTRPSWYVPDSNFARYHKKPASFCPDFINPWQLLTNRSERFFKLLTVPLDITCWDNSVQWSTTLTSQDLVFSAAGPQHEPADGFVFVQMETIR